MPVQISELLEPIAGANPAGASLRYEPVYDQIRQARTEEEDLPTGAFEHELKSADYALVVRLATEALARRSKDLQLAAWLTEALLKRDGLPGLTQGLQLLRSLVDGFWEHLYPELDEDGDKQFRAAPLGWVGQYLDRAVRLVPIDVQGHTVGQSREARAVGFEADAGSYEAQEARAAAVQAGKTTGEQFEAGVSATTKAWYKQLVADLDAALEALDGLELTCQDRFADDAPGFSPLRQALDELRQEVRPLLAHKLELDPDPVVVEPPPPAAGLEETAVAGAAGGAAAPAMVAANTRAGAEASIAGAARFLRAEAPTNPASYLLLRGFRWGELRDGDGGIDPIMLASPPPGVRTRLKRLLLEQKWQELLEASEEVMATPCGRGWLDLQRYCVTACDALGGEYARVGAAIRGALRGLLRDLPALASATLDDDVPNANPETKAWLGAEGLISGEPAEEVVATPAPPPRFRRDAGEQARELVRAGQPQKAIELLMREADQERSARSRFLRRSQAAAIMVDSGLEAVATPILQQLTDQVQHHSLEEWEDGETVAQVLALLYRCLLKVGDTSSTQDLYLRVCRLDPLQGMQLQPQ